ncbi:class I SAM-dependent methyltransferase [Bdellovibrio bacteriovorus]
MSDKKYFPQVFIPQSFEHAKDIILSSDPTGEKWIKETEQTCQAIVKAFKTQGQPINEQSLLLDYGCGIGRIAKRLIELTGCSILGLDISPGMLYYSLPYVNTDRFIPCPQPRIKTLSEAGMKADGAVAIWALQHCLEPNTDLKLISEALKPGSLFFVVNKIARYVPVEPTAGYVNWHDDKSNVLDLIMQDFELIETLPPIDSVEEGYCKVFRKK